MSEPESRPPRRHLQFGVRKLLATVTVLAVIFATYGWYHHRLLMPRLHSVEVGRLIKSLAERRPSNMTRGQWASAVACTINLHENCPMIFDTPAPTIEEFEQRLRTRLAGNVDMDTIHWIWSEYARTCPAGARYQVFKSMHA